MPLFPFLVTCNYFVFSLGYLTRGNSLAIYDMAIILVVRVFLFGHWFLYYASFPILTNRLDSTDLLILSPPFSPFHTLSSSFFCCLCLTVSARLLVCLSIFLPFSSLSRFQIMSTHVLTTVCLLFMDILLKICPCNFLLFILIFQTVYLSIISPFFVLVPFLSSNRKNQRLYKHDLPNMLTCSHQLTVNVF